MELTAEAVEAVVATALAEDVGEGDLTTDRIVPSGVRCRAELLIEEPGVVCGVPAAVSVFTTLDTDVTVDV
ncbi:MAG TPA: hypothetical protein VG265_10580, partial [Gaiellaceae bacterium]|nr:hypothetical protein [Gaiellaceae bacterium]